MEETERKMTKAEFWIRFGVWLALAVVAPIVYLAVSYGLFTFHEESTSLSGWGVLALVFAVSMLLYIINQAKKGMPSGSMAKQCIDGYMALIPVFAFILLLQVIKTNVEGFQRFLIFMIICEAVAVPVNPIPKWAMQNHIDMAENFLVKTIKKAIGKDEDKH